MLIDQLDRNPSNTSRYLEVLVFKGKSWEAYKKLLAKLGGGMALSFKLETTEMDLGDTLIENIFINDFMPMANGTFVKVYLLGFKYAADKDSKVELNNQTIAKNLEIPLEDVLDAWDFWEKKGIIKKIKNKEEDYNYRVEFLSLKQLYIKNNYKLLQDEEEKKEEGVTARDLTEANQNPAINNMYTFIRKTIQRETSITEKMEILSWIKDYNMNPDVIEYAFSYAVNIAKVSYNHVKYVGATILNWYDRGLTNLEAVIEDFEKKDQRYYNYNKILKEIGISLSNINNSYKEIIDSWFDQYNYDMDIILEACSRTVNTNNPSIKYINGIIENWYKSGVRTREDIERVEALHHEKNKLKRQGKTTNYQVTSKKQTRFHNFEQRTDKYTKEELEEVAKRKRQEYIKKIRGEV